MSLLMILFGEVNVEGKNHLGHTGLYGKIILKWIIENWDLR